MGIEGRDYYRDSSRYTDRLTGWGWGWGAVPPVCKWIIVTNIIVFLLQILVTRSPRASDLQQLLDDADEVSREVSEDASRYLALMPNRSLVEDWFALKTDSVLHGQIWRVLTYAFCHDRFSIWHLALNMLFFFWLGPTLEAMYGSREFLLFYLSSAILAGVTYVGLDLLTGGSTPAIGASGAVMGVTMLYAIHYPRSVIYIMFIIPVEIRWLVVLYVIVDLHPVLLALGGNGVQTGVAHAAHLGGLAFGFLYWKFNLRLEQFVSGMRGIRWRRAFRAHPTVRVYRPAPQDEPDDSDARVDDILRKIHEHGEASLTEGERQVLIAASRRHKNRNR